LGQERVGEGLDVYVYDPSASRPVEPWRALFNMTG
jgi:hypothetical protein